jgi:hypothetical protein
VHSHHLGPVGTFFQIIAAIASAALGFIVWPALEGILTGSVLFTVGYIFVRLPQMLATYQRDGAKILLAFVYLLVGNCLLSGAFYGLGRLVSWALH